MVKNKKNVKGVPTVPRKKKSDPVATFNARLLSNQILVLKLESKKQGYVLEGKATDKIEEQINDARSQITKNKVFNMLCSSCFSHQIYSTKSVSPLYIFIYV
jgi:hypothetical protein